MNVLPEFLAILEKDYTERLSTPILRIIGNLLTGDEDVTQYCLNLKVIHHLQLALNQTESNNKARVREILWCFSNIAAGSENQSAVILF